MKYIVECKPDKHLIKVITNASKKAIVHSANKAEAIKTLLKAKAPSIAIIDEDPGSPQPSFLKRFKLKQDLSQWGLKVYKESSSEKSLVVISPRLEDWLLRAGKESGISFKEYSLPENAERLHKVINTNLEKLKLILKDLLKRENKRLLKLKEALEN